VLFYLYFPSVKVHTNVVGKILKHIGITEAALQPQNQNFPLIKV